MKTNYPRTNNRRKIVIIAGLIAVFLPVLYFFGGMLYRGAERTLQSGAAIFWRAGNGADSLFASYGVLLKSKQTLERENEELTREIDRLSHELLSYPLLAAENETLKNVLGRSGSRTLILAAVLARPGRSPYDTLVIDAGKNVGVTEGAPVVVDGVIPLGTVAKVYGSSSKVKLYSAPGNSFDVLIGATTSIAALAQGEGGGNFSITLPRDVEISEGDAVSVPSLHIALLGTIEHIAKEANDSFQTIRFRSPVNMQELKWVEVEIGEEQPALREKAPGETTEESSKDQKEN